MPSNYNTIITNNIIFNDKTHIVSEFKEYLVIDDEGEFLKRPIEVGKIILATNLAARGTDIKISRRLEKNGGLHVILTFFPASERIERQALGRAGRKGENGSGKIMLYGNASYEDFKNNYDLFIYNTNLILANISCFTNNFNICLNFLRYSK